MKFVEAAQGYAAVGSEHRLSVLITLVKAGPDGLSIGEIQGKLKIAPSTLSHHLRFLTDAGLVHQTRQGRTVFNKANFEQIELLGNFLLEECCADVARDTDRHRVHKAYEAV